MILELIDSLGPWNWIVFGLVLLGLEILISGTFLLWFGIAALAVGSITLIVGTESEVWTWQVQVLVFLVGALGSAFIGRKILSERGWDRSEKPMLNKRGEKMVGRTVVLSDAIANGSGRAKIGDTIWQVTGPDLPKGTKVRISGSAAGILQVEAIE